MFGSQRGNSETWSYLWLRPLPTFRDSGHGIDTHKIFYCRRASTANASYWHAQRPCRRWCNKSTKDLNNYRPMRLAPDIYHAMALQCYYLIHVNYLFKYFPVSTQHCTVAVPFPLTLADVPECSLSCIVCCCLYHLPSNHRNVFFVCTVSVLPPSSLHVVCRLLPLSFLSSRLVQPRPRTLLYQKHPRHCCRLVVVDVHVVIIVPGR